MANFIPGQRVLLRSGKIGTIDRILVDGALATDTSYLVAMEPGATLIKINGLDVMEALPPAVDDYFALQRRIVRQALGPGAQKVASFKQHMHSGHEAIRNRRDIAVRLVYEEERPPTVPNASVVFMGMKTIPAEVAGAIQKYGITALKYLEGAATVPASYITAMSAGAKDPNQANEMRRRFVQERERRIHPQVTGLDEFRLLQLANAHKSGPGVSTSGFHSTSGKPSYASEYADASGQVIGKPYYNLGAAIEITDQCYPLVIQQAIEHWNQLSNKDRYGNLPITMAFAKTDESWKRDYESEILLGGATLPTDFVYFGLWEVTRQAMGIMGGLKNDLLGALKKKEK